ncbi:MAG: hypothetical protein A2X46_09930 [Lentisphaerae bacterium GWF2_57_35]|nr:MAG: hypothetical protein A2X46_09930 [Lentisphaerae bacterium GWF2_57_35]
MRSILDAKTPVAVVDARTAQYDDGKRISGAISLPADSSTEAIEKALPDKNQLVVTYCSNLKCPASKILSEKLIEMGYKNVLKYPDGLEGWLQAGQPAAEASKPM